MKKNTSHKTLNRFKHLTRRFVLALSLSLILAVALTACTTPEPQPTTPPEQPPVTTPPGEKPPVEDLSYTTPPFAFPIEGGYHEGLALEQEALKEKGQLFGLLIDNTEDWTEAIEAYRFESAREGQGLNYGDDYFESYALLIVFAEQGSSSIQYQFGKAEATDSLIDVTIEQYLPEIGTADMVLKGFVAGMEKDALYLPDGSPKPLNITQRTISPTTDTPVDDLTVEDLRLGNLSVRLAALELDFRMAQKPELVELAHDGYEQWRYYENGIEILIIENEVFMISTENPDYPTPRGLKVGDTLETLNALYGEASMIEALENGNQLHSFDLSGEYHLFHAEIKGDTIVRLQVNLTM
jgi:hypothetical protein